MQIFWSIYLFLLGALFASFFNVMGIRISDHVSVLRRSHCPKCDHQLRFIDVIPLVGFIINGGKCHFCKEKIHIKYFLIELIGGLLYMFTYLKYGFSLKFIPGILITSMIMIIVVTMYEHRRVYYECTYVIMPLLIICDIITKSYYSLLTGLIAGILMLILSAFNKDNLKYVLIAICCGLIMNIESFLISLGVIVIFKIIEKVIKRKIDYVYIFSLCTILSLYFLTNLIFIKIWM